MHTARLKRNPRRLAPAAAVAFAALFTALALAASPAAAQAVEGGKGQAAIAPSAAGGAAAPAASAPQAAAVPRVTPRSDGRVRYWDFTKNSAGYRDASAWVHSRLLCGDAFCTIQPLSNVYRVFSMSGCDTFDLSYFGGYYASHNHGSMAVHLLDASDRWTLTYRGGADHALQWDPIWAVRTCNR